MPTGPDFGLKSRIVALILRMGPIPVPPGPVTETGPVAARFGTFTEICVSERTCIPVPLTVPPPAFVNATWVAPVKHEPRTVIFLPTACAALL